MKDVRAMLLLQNLEELGTIHSTTPPARELLEDGKFDGSFEILIESEAGGKMRSGRSLPARNSRFLPSPHRNRCWMLLP